MGLLGQVLTGVVASRMGRGGMGGPLGGALGGAMMGGMGRGRGGSPVMKALLLVLAAKAAQNYMQNRQGSPGAGGTGLGGQPGQPRTQGGQPGGLGGLLAGVAGGGGLGALVEQFTRTGHGDAINSWIGKGPNQPLPPQQLAEALGPDTVEALEQESGLPREAVLSELAETLPEAVDQLSPEGVPPPPQALAGDDDDFEELVGKG